MSHPRGVCSYPDCGKPHKARGWCAGHYSHWQRGEAPHDFRVHPIGCAYDGCDRKHNSHGYCSMHSRLYVTGQALRPLQVIRDVTVRDELGRKQCARCGKWLAVAEFRAAPNTSDRLRVWCQVCTNTKRYNLARPDFEAMLAAQGGACAICGGLSADGKALHVDHDHRCCPVWGRSCGSCVRGLLCSECNKGLGLFRDDINLLAQAAVYLSTRAAA